MTHFLTDYPDLCVFEQRCENGDEEHQDSRLTTTHLEDDRPYDAENTRNGMASPALSKRQSSTPSPTAPFLLPVLKLKNLTLKQDTSCCNSLITDDSMVSKDVCASKKNDFDYERFSSNSDRPSTENMDEGGVKSTNDRDPVNIFATLYLGNAENAGDLETLRRYNIKYILNVTYNLPNHFEDDKSFKYLRIPIVDNGPQNLVSFFPMANEFIGKHFLFFIYLRNILYSRL